MTRLRQKHSLSSIIKELKAINDPTVYVNPNEPEEFLMNAHIHFGAELHRFFKSIPLGFDFKQATSLPWLQSEWEQRWFKRSTQDMVGFWTKSKKSGSVHKKFFEKGIRAVNHYWLNSYAASMMFIERSLQAPLFPDFTPYEIVLETRYDQWMIARSHNPKNNPNYEDVFIVDIKTGGSLLFNNDSLKRQWRLQAAIASLLFLVRFGRPPKGFQLWDVVSDERFTIQWHELDYESLVFAHVSSIVKRKSDGKHVPFDPDREKGKYSVANIIKNMTRYSTSFDDFVALEKARDHEKISQTQLGFELETAK